ncbi:trifolitoxin synthesis, TfuA [Mesorhizobium sp. B2-1-8]|uniref:AfsR/SARP family transcriptional regulator n=1 Tax=Mesorhizobium sp. B2-1-8 TaxID=2589967 RepID=UPI001D11196A|nr:BTAD domain-containing putative transcriptional regulator [Mesorhizobium sp. B2-1-8]UCI21368.1 trifolitoxin synthesis, TfuA [Mesorhizobium sp. B2-1-8]
MRNRKSRAVLAYLALSPHGFETRERICGLLWSESDEARARASLRQTVVDLKACLAEVEGVFFGDRLNVTLKQSHVTVDVSEIRRDLKAGRIPPVLLERQRVAESFLNGLDDIDPSFRNWVLVQRQCLQDEFISCLEAMAKAAADWPALKRAGQALHNLDPTNEVGCRAIMEASARMGDQATALRAYNGLWDLLETEFDSEPSAATQALVSDIKLGIIGGASKGHVATPASGLGSQAPRLQEPAAGVLLFVREFELVSGSVRARNAVRIFRSELVASLVRFRDWAVMEWEGQPPRLTENAYCIEATAFLEGPTLRVSMTLKQLATGRYIWSEQFVIENSQWYQTQQRLIRRIAVALGVSMSSERLVQIASIPDLSLEQFDRWLRAQELIFQWRPESEERAEALFRSIIAESPQFAAAHAGLAGIINSRHLIFPGIGRRRERHAEALTFAKQATQIDPIDSRSQLHLAWSYAMNGMPQQAAISFLLACELNGNDPWTLVSASLGLAYCDDRENAHRIADLALQTGLGVSRLQWSYQAGVRFLLGDYAGCVEAAERAADSVSYIGGWKAAALALLGDERAAHEEADRFLAQLKTEWFGYTPPEPGNVGRWLMDSFPICNSEALETLRRGLAGAGIVVSHEPLPGPALSAAPNGVVGDA